MAGTFWPLRTQGTGTEENVVRKEGRRDAAARTERKSVWKKTVVNVPDLASRIHDVVLVRRIFSSGKPRGVRNFEWGGNGEGMKRGRSVYKQPGTKVDGILSR
jgi:hypothetical protein